VRILGVSADDAPDVAQACTVEVLRHLGDFDATRGRFDGWVSGFALNSVRAYNRGARKLRAEVALDDVAEPIIVENAATSKRAGLDMALNKLAKKDRNLLSMKFGMGLSSDEIAEQVKMSPTQVRKRISRAIERLRRQPAIQDILSS
jgi:RNA polymerase sigma-70 factor (ECF subfamily)